MDLLGHLEEAFVSTDDLPVRDDTEVVQQRHGRPQGFRHAAAVRRRVHVEDARTSQRSCVRARSSRSDSGAIS